jgi:hypothetical protein
MDSPARTTDFAEYDLDLALENGEVLLEVVAVGRRAAAGRRVHIDQAVSAGGVLARHKNGVGVARQPDVGQGPVVVRSRKR